jgi:hypothetical protein
LVLGPAGFDYEACPAAPVLHPTAEELASPLQYIRSVVVPAAASTGMAVLRMPMATQVGPADTIAAMCRRNLQTFLNAQTFHYSVQLREGDRLCRDKATLNEWRAAAATIDVQAARAGLFADAAFFAGVAREDEATRPLRAASVACRYGVTPTQLPWSPAALPLARSSPLRLLPWPASAMHTPRLQVAQRHSYAAWATEPLDLFACSLLHEGKPVVWYALPPTPGGAAPMVERIKSLATDGAGMVDPALLAKHDLRAARAVQQPGDMVIALPGACTAHWAQGYAVSEAALFADGAWLDAGLAAAGRCCSSGYNSYRPI